MDNLFCGACDIDGRCDAGVLNGDGYFCAADARRSCDCRCLVAGDGLLPALDESRSPGGTASGAFRVGGGGAVLLLGALAADLFWLKGVSVSLSRGARGIARAPLPSSHGSFVPAARCVNFLTGVVGVALVFACPSALPGGASEITAIATRLDCSGHSAGVLRIDDIYSTVSRVPVWIN